jgi:hypothetical protein
MFTTFKLELKNAWSTQKPKDFLYKFRISPEISSFVNSNFFQFKHQKMKKREREIKLESCLAEWDSSKSSALINEMLI